MVPPKAQFLEKSSIRRIFGNWYLWGLNLRVRGKIDKEPQNILAMMRVRPTPPHNYFVNSVFSNSWTKIPKLSVIKLSSLRISYMTSEMKRLPISISFYIRRSVWSDFDTSNDAIELRVVLLLLVSISLSPACLNCKNKDSGFLMTSFLRFGCWRVSVGSKKHY